MKKLTFLAVAAALLLTGCTRAVYLPAQSSAVRADTLAVMRWRTDTVIDRDTVTLTQRGDTVYVERTRWRWRVKESADTVYAAKTDSVYVEKPVPVEVVREVERKRPWWETALLWAAAAALGALVIKVCVRANKQ